MKSLTPSSPPYRYRIGLRAMVLCAGFVTLLTGLSMRLIYLQHTRHEAVMLAMEDESLRKEVIPAQRGDILDRDLRPLATTQPVSDLILDKYQIPKTADIHRIAAKQLGMGEEELAHLPEHRCIDLYYRMLAAKLAQPLGRDSGELFQRFSENLDELVIHKGLDSEMVRDLVAELKNDDYSGLRYRDSMARAYVSDDLACHVLGYVYHNLEGASGIETTMNGFLAGTDGARIYDLQGELISETLPEHGRHVVLTLDATFQDMAEKIMDRHYAALRPHAMTAIFAEPSTGEILALVNRPGFHPADGGNADPEARWNTAVASIYEPGSTFKIVTHGAAMDLGLVNLDSWVSCYNGYYEEGNWSLTDTSKRWESAAVRDVIAHSLNTGTFMVAQQMKPLAFYHYMGRFGLGQKTGIRLPAEAAGRIPHPDRGWGRKRMELSRLGMGYLFNASPLQILGFINVVCNQGNLVKPRIVRQILSHDSQQVTAQLESEVVEGVIGRRTANRLRNALIHAVEEGTGKRAQIDGYVVGGKTGTAGKTFPMPNKKSSYYIDNRNIVSFLGFVGTDIEAALIGIVLVDDPQNEGSRQGGSVAGPIFKEIAEAGMEHFGIRRLDVAEAETDP